MLDEQVLEEAQRLSGERTFSRTVQIALEDFVRRAKARRNLSLRGIGTWQGDLAEMREDHGGEARERTRKSCEMARKGRGFTQRRRDAEVERG